VVPLAAMAMADIPVGGDPVLILIFLSSTYILSYSLSCLMNSLSLSAPAGAVRLAAGIPADWAEAGSPRLPAGDRAAYANLLNRFTHTQHIHANTHTYTHTGTGRHMTARGRGVEGARGISDGATN
jgi:hypothetical protein